jgi:multidrug resistance efflux pump
VSGRRWGRNLLGGAAVLATILGIVFVLPAIDRAVPADRAAPAHRQTIAEGISVVPPTGALIAKRTRAGSTTGSILFLIGPARYVISVEPFEGDVVKASQRLRTKIQSMRGYQVTGAESTVVTTSGLAGLGSEFTAPGRSGRYIAFVVPGRAVEVTVNVSETDLQQALLPIDASIASISWSGGK